MLFLHAAHHHAEMACFDHHTHTQRLNRILNCLSYLHGEALLYLQTAGKNIYQAGNLAQAHHFPVRDISDVYFSKEWQHMMLTQAEHLDIFHDDHLVITDVKERVSQYG